MPRFATSKCHVFCSLLRVLFSASYFVCRFLLPTSNIVFRDFGCRFPRLRAPFSATSSAISARDGECYFPLATSSAVFSVFTISSVVFRDFEYRFWSLSMPFSNTSDTGFIPVRCSCFMDNIGAFQYMSSSIEPILRSSR